MAAARSPPDGEDDVRGSIRPSRPPSSPPWAGAPKTTYATRDHGADDAGAMRPSPTARRSVSDHHAQLRAEDVWRRRSRNDESHTNHTQKMPSPRGGIEQAVKPAFVRQAEHPPRQHPPVAPTAAAPVMWGVVVFCGGPSGGGDEGRDPEGSTTNRTSCCCGPSFCLVARDNSGTVTPGSGGRGRSERVDGGGGVLAVVAWGNPTTTTCHNAHTTSHTSPPPAPAAAPRRRRAGRRRRVTLFCPQDGVRRWRGERRAATSVVHPSVTRCPVPAVSILKINHHGSINVESQDTR